MNELIDKNLLTLFDGLYNHISSLFGEFVSDAQALAAIFAMCYFAIESYKLMVGDKKLEFMPLLRPFAIFMVLVMWIPFVNIISYPPKVITNHSKAMFGDRIDEVELLSRQRYALVDSVAMKLATSSLEVERAEDESKDSKWYEFGINLDFVKDKIAGLYLLITAKIKYLMFQLVEFIVVTFWQVCVYFIFFLQIIFMSILIILGPLSFAISILPAFKDAYVAWIARFISVSLYVAIAYIILAVTMMIMSYSLEKEITILQQAMANEDAFIMYAAMSSGGVNIFMVTCLIGAFSMLSIPFVSTWIVQTSGVGHAVGAAVGGAAKAAL